MHAVNAVNACPVSEGAEARGVEQAGPSESNNTTDGAQVWAVRAHALWEQRSMGAYRGGEGEPMR